ncbi:MAG: hypothetical protein JW956_14130 [Calditrichaceae bacterium]|nr:hypothetical protein [Calditrichaceae bacterium]
MRQYLLKVANRKLTFEEHQLIMLEILNKKKSDYKISDITDKMFVMGYLNAIHINFMNILFQLAKDTSNEEIIIVEISSNLVSELGKIENKNA